MYKQEPSAQRKEWMDACEMRHSTAQQSDTNFLGEEMKLGEML